MFHLPKILAISAILSLLFNTIALEAKGPVSILQQRIQSKRIHRLNVLSSNISTAKSSSSIASIYTQCTSETWICTIRGYCINGMTDNFCQRRLSSNQGEMLKGACLNPEAVKPPSKIPCGSSSSISSISILEKMKTNMNTWTEARKELTSKLTIMGNQPSGRGCMSTLAQIDQDWVFNYNNYVSISNNLNNGDGNWGPALQTVEIQMNNVIDRIHLAPTFCY